MRFLLLLLLIAPPCFARGNEGAHAGDVYSQEFATLGVELVEDLLAFERKNPSQFQRWGFTAGQFQNALRTTRVTSEEVLLFNNREVDALNYNAPDEIKLNRRRWREAELTGRLKLVLHEYLGVLKVEHDHFLASAEFQDLAVATKIRIAASKHPSTYMGNLYYGRCISVPALGVIPTCEANSEKLRAAETCAMSQAEGKCRLNGNSKCELSMSTFAEVLSTTQVGLRYCEVLVIMK